MRFLLPKLGFLPPSSFLHRGFCRWYFIFAVCVKNLVRTGAAATASQTHVNGDKCMVVMDYLRTAMDVSSWLYVLRHLAGRRLRVQSCDSERIEVLLQLLQRRKRDDGASSSRN